MTWRLLFLSICMTILLEKGESALSKIPTSLHKVGNDPEETELKCNFLLEKDAKLAKLEWWAVYGEKRSKILFHKVDEKPEISEEYQSIVTKSELKMKKKLSAHMISLERNGMKGVTSYQCVVHDNRGRVGQKRLSTTHVMKKTIKESISNTTDEACGGNFTGDSGTIFSPNYPFDYPNNSDCEYVVRVNTGRVVSFKFNSLELESCCGCDFLEIRDGPTEFDPLIATICFSQNTSQTFTTTGNVGYVRFRSDFSVREAGFSLGWKAEAPGNDTACGGSLVGRSGIIQSPNYPLSYPNNAQCEWTVITNTSSVIYFELLAFDLEDCCSCDSLEIRDGLSGVDSLLRRFCDPLGNTSSTAIQTSGHTANIRFTSDPSVTASGFQLYWERRDFACGGDLTGNSGTIESPNYPSDYPDGTDCEWVVRVQPGLAVVFDLNFLDLENCCGCDYIEIRDGPSESDPLIATICSPQNSSQAIATTSGNAAYVRFRSDSSITASGFSLSWRTNETCGGTIIDGSSGVIHSPNYPLNYPDNADCEWRITVDSALVVYFELYTFDLEDCCSCDSLQVRDGLSSSDPLLITFCDPAGRNETVVTTGNTANVRFTSDASVTAQGFQLYWQARNPNNSAHSPRAVDPFAFSASVSANYSEVNANDIVFDDVLYNGQNVYNPLTGIFFPRVHGVYFVTTSILSDFRSAFRVYIRRNENEILCKSSASPNAIASCSAVMEMLPGDEIRVTGDASFPGVAVGFGFSGFSGYIVARLDV